MQFDVAREAQVVTADLVTVWLARGERVGLATEVGQLAQALLDRDEWKPDAKSAVLLYGGKGGKQRLLLVGLGAAKDVTADTLKRAAGITWTRAKGVKAKRIGVVTRGVKLAPAAAGDAIAEGFVLASYVAPARKKNADKAAPSPRVSIAADKNAAAVESAIDRGRIVAEATNRARRLGDLPGNELTPTDLATQAQAMARDAGVRCKVHRAGDLRRMKMGGILGVGKGSAEPPVLIELHHAPKRYTKTVCIVGKGITFDTGGISIKPSAGMEEMKYDMCGGAAVVGAVEAAARLKLPIRVIGIIASAENMPGSRAQKPGDTLTTASGHTVEVINTDAEGRLVLADALHHATTFEPDAIVDLATLTGACVVALGHDAAGLFTRHDALRKALQDAADAAGDPLWPMPVFAEMEEDLKSTVADLKNLGSREGGASWAAVFLKTFVGDVPWAHLDIAGTAWGMRSREYLAKGATGAGVRLLVKWLEGLR
ncbi:MAG: leucyl aminopeptidase [Planctomycetes bacterium]|nr:leucyl aminopeptidase [Planctomycetota bacterium]